ncbi:hypothetical protein LCGC14_2951640, partial [marine sediment metagenome]
MVHIKRLKNMKRKVSKMKNINKELASLGVCAVGITFAFSGSADDASITVLGVLLIV